MVEFTKENFIPFTQLIQPGNIMNKGEGKLEGCYVVSLGIIKLNNPKLHFKCIEDFDQ
jgi:hypothetical protein